MTRSPTCRLVALGCRVNQSDTEYVQGADPQCPGYSSGSVVKDTEVLRDLYSRAGIPEYWLVDARGDRLAFDILRHTAKGYVATRKQAGWLKSAIFGKSFHLTRREDEMGHPEYTLAVR